MARCCSRRSHMPRRSTPSPTALRCCGGWRAKGPPWPDGLGSDADEYAQRAFPRSSVPFADVHMALFAAATRNQAALEERLAVIEKRIADGKLPAGPVVPKLFRAMSAFAGGDYRGCVAHLEPVLD